MKIEISEVFITRADSITMDSAMSSIGIAALEPGPKTVGWGQQLLAVLRNIFRKSGSAGLKKVTFSDRFQINSKTVRGTH